MNSKQSCFYTIASDIKNICPVIEEILNFFDNAYSELSDCCKFDLKVILNELITNAIRHGNKSMEASKVKIYADVIEDKSTIKITDEGSGFNPAEKISVALEKKTNEELLDFCETGRGLLIVKSLADSVKFNKKGNSITVVKSLKRV